MYWSLKDIFHLQPTDRLTMCRRWMFQNTKPHQRTAGFDAGCAWAQSAPESSSSELLGWCWSPLVHSPTSQTLPEEKSRRTLTLSATSQYQRWKVHSGILTHIEKYLLQLWFLRFKYMKCSMSDYLQVDHVSGKGYFWVLSGVHHGDVGLFDLLLNKPCSEESSWFNQLFMTEKRDLKLHHSLSFLSISSHLLTSFTNLRWNTFTSGFSCAKKDQGESFMTQ